MRVLLSILFVIAAVPAFADYTFVGVGVTIAKDRNDPVQVVDLVPNGPAMRSGVNIGEYIAAINNENAGGMSVDDVVSRLRGPAGTPVTLALSPDKTLQSHRDVTLVRELITIPCFVEGWVNLNLNGNPANGYLNGYINNIFVNWNIMNGRVQGYYRGQTIVLDSYINGNMWVMSGFIHNTYVRWQSFNANMSVQQACVP